MESVIQLDAVHVVPISTDLFNKLNRLGLIPNDVRSGHIGKSDYSKHIIQPWSIWIDYELNPWDADIVKRILRTKEEPGMSAVEARIMDYTILQKYFYMDLYIVRILLILPFFDNFIDYS